MATVPNPVTAVPGLKLTSLAWNREVRDAVNFFLQDKPLCQLAQGAAQSIPASTPTPVSFPGVGDEIIDSDAQHETSVNPSRVNIGKTLGLYRLTGVVAFGGNAAPYAPYVEFGTGSGVNVPQGFEAYAMQFYVNGKGTMKAQPFLIPAFIKYKNVFLRDIRKIAKNISK